MTLMQVGLDDKYSLDAKRIYLSGVQALVRLPMLQRERDRMAGLMGGRAAEEIFLNHITTGAGNDIERATEIARQMVCEWGMSSLGPLTFGKKE